MTRDTTGNGFVALAGSFTWQQASTACVDLGVGWALATLTDPATAVSVMGVGPGASNDCFGHVPGGGTTSFWIVSVNIAATLLAAAFVFCATTAVHLSVLTSHFQGLYDPHCCLDRQASHQNRS